jgi:hypothetical protein
MKFPVGDDHFAKDRLLSTFLHKNCQFVRVMSGYAVARLAHFPWRNSLGLGQDEKFKVIAIYQNRTNYTFALPELQREVEREYFNKTYQFE